MVPESLLECTGLTDHERALVCLGVLLEGSDAPTALGCFAGRGEALAELARSYSALDDEVRIPILGTILRGILER